MISRTAEDLVGHTIEGYRLEGVLGRGGMGIVFAARNERTGRAVALKLLHAHHVHRDSVVRRFLREARAAASLEHDHVVRVLDVVNASGGWVFLVLERLRGKPLSALLGSPLPAATVAALLGPIADALRAAHAAGVVHRDVKPSNVFLTTSADGLVPKLVDFGVAKLLDGDGESETMTGQALGTPGYMAPEQLRGEPSVGAPADVWAFGVLMHEALTGSRPGPRGELANGLDAAFEQSIADCLQERAADRPTMSELTERLRTLAGGGRWAPTVPPEGWTDSIDAPTTGAPPPRPRGRRLAAGVLAVGLVGALGVWAVSSGGQPAAAGEPSVDTLVDAPSSAARADLEPQPPDEPSAAPARRAEPPLRVEPPTTGSAAASTRATGDAPRVRRPPRRHAETDSAETQPPPEAPPVDEPPTLGTNRSPILD